MTTEQEIAVTEYANELRDRCNRLDAQAREWRDRAWAAERVRDEMAAAVRILMQHSTIEPASILDRINSQSV